MTAEIGHFALWLALGASLCLGVVPLWGAQRGMVSWMALARPLSHVMGACCVVAFVALAASFANNDFSVLNVASNSNSDLPLHYRLAAVWGSHEGSLLLWMLMQSGWMVAVALFSRHLPLPMVARILAVMGWIAVGFLLFTLLTSNPFDRLWPPAPEGRDLNPLLQDPGMVFHPPLLYMGYVGFSVAFAFAVAALIEGRLDSQWARWTRPWTVAAWASLTLGIALGSFWAYYELGWGGWWFWDPVENASFMPWLVGTALIHSLAVTEKRGAFKSWTVLLAIVAFSMSLLGTFLVRSGVLSSVHAFATDPTRGLFILVFLVAVVGLSLTLYAWRAPKVGLGARFGALSRESLLLANNVMLSAAAAAVLLGTLYPLVLDAVGGGKISVGTPYFEAVFAPLMAPLLFLMAVGPLARWKQAELPVLWTRLRWALGVSILAALASSWAAGHFSWGSALGLWLAWWVTAGVATEFWDLVRPRGSAAADRFLARLRRVPRATLGMMVAHLGVAVFVVGVTMVNTHEVERDVRLATGEATMIEGYSFTLRGLRRVEGPNYSAIQGWVEVVHEGRRTLHLLPEKRIYRAQPDNPMTEAAISSGFARDLYVSLGEPLPDGAWTVRVYLKPFVSWIWIGCLIMALGGVFAVTDQRYRRRLSERNEQGTASEGSGASADDASTAGAGNLGGVPVPVPVPAAAAVGLAAAGPAGKSLGSNAAA